MLDQAEQRILHSVFRLLEAAEQTARKTQQARRLAVDQAGQRELIAGGDRLHLRKIGGRMILGLVGRQ